MYAIPFDRPHKPNPYTIQYIPAAAIVPSLEASYSVRDWLERELSNPVFKFFIKDRCPFSQVTFLEHKGKAPRRKDTKEIAERDFHSLLRKRKYIILEPVSTKEQFIPVYSKRDPETVSLLTGDLLALDTVMDFHERLLTRWLVHRNTELLLLEEAGHSLYTHRLDELTWSDQDQFRIEALNRIKVEQAPVYEKDVAESISVYAQQGHQLALGTLHRAITSAILDRYKPEPILDAKAGRATVFLKAKIVTPWTGPCEAIVMTTTTRDILKEKGISQHAGTPKLVRSKDLSDFERYPMKLKLCHSTTRLFGKSARILEKSLSGYMERLICESGLPTDDVLNKFLDKRQKELDI